MFVKRSSFLGFSMLSLGALLTGCGSSDDGGGGTGGQPAATGTSLTLRFEMAESSEGVPFVTPNASVVSVPKADLVGKPLMFVAYPAEFSPGNDPPLYTHWDVVPEDLRFEHETPSFTLDAVDVAMVIYQSTPITAEDKEKSAQFAPTPSGGDISALSFSKVREGEQDPTPGCIRVYLDEGPGEIELANRTPKDPTNMADVGASFTNTLMLLP